MCNVLYCRVFINSEISIEELTDLIESTVEIKPDKFRTFEGDFFDIGVVANKEYDEKKCREFPDGFLFYRFNLEASCTNLAKKETYFELLTNIMNALWAEGMKLVASCDFEEMLPNQGGYSKRINY